ncbi:MAG: hypothetical protein HQL95_01055 [Magnetococcales bacterium]|nr:hypothetical protein [Magnetococcales bacterium]
MLKILCSQKEIFFESDLKLDIQGIDAQHEQLFILCHAVMESKFSDLLKIEAVLFEIESYISEHLAYEEQILTRSSALTLLQHKRLHDQFREQYTRLNAKVLSSHHDMAALQTISVEIATLLQ